jgi:outer membrane cobalamin receptor
LPAQGFDYLGNPVNSGDPGLNMASRGGGLEDKTHSKTWFGYAQYLKTFQSFGLTLGARSDQTIFGNSVAPRAGMTYKSGSWHGKLLYGRGFRTPLLFQAFSRINVNDPAGLKPEKSESIELEAGYKFSENVKARINAFSIQIEEPITYVPESAYYSNFGKVQSYGLEGEIQARYKTHGEFFNFAFAKPGSSTSNNFVTADKKDFLALPPLKVNLGGYYSISSYKIGPTFTYLSERFGQSKTSALSTPLVRESTSYESVILTNLSLAYEANKDFVVKIVGHNIFDSKYTLIQPYYGAHAPVPAQDRQIRLELNANL